MPIFDLRCSACGAEEYDVVLAGDAPIPSCSCSGLREKIWRRSAPVRIFHAGVYEHVSDEPMYFDSREKLKDHVKRNGMVMDYVDGY